ALHQVWVHLRAGGPGPGEPRRPGAFIQAKRRNNRLRRTAVAQQGERYRHQVGRAAQPVAGRARRGRGGPPARVAYIPRLRLAMPPDGALPHRPSGRAGGVVTELRPRGHAATPAGRVSETRQPEHASVDPPLHPQTTVERGGTPIREYEFKSSTRRVNGASETGTLGAGGERCAARRRTRWPGLSAGGAQRRSRRLRASLGGWPGAVAAACARRPTGSCRPRTRGRAGARASAGKASGSSVLWAAPAWATSTGGGGSAG